MPTVTFRSLIEVGLSPRGLYSLGLGTLLGSGVWVTFIAGIIMFKTLPRQQFGNVQKKLVPAYYTLSSAVTAGVLALQLSLHPLPRPFFPSLRSRSDSAVLPFLLGTSLSLSLVNLFAVTPWVTGIMDQRHKLERKEGKAYHEPEVSEEMKVLNKRFATAHGVSSILTLAFFIPVAIVSAWVGQHGI